MPKFRRKVLSLSLREKGEKNYRPKKRKIEEKVNYSDVSDHLSCENDVISGTHKC